MSAGGCAQGLWRNCAKCARWRCRAKGMRGEAMMAIPPVTSPDADDSMDCEKIRKRIRPGRRADSYPHVTCECAVTQQRAEGESYSWEWSARWFARVRRHAHGGRVRAVVPFQLAHRRPGNHRLFRLLLRARWGLPSDPLPSTYLQRGGTRWCLRPGAAVGRPHGVARRRADGVRRVGRAGVHVRAGAIACNKVSLRKITQHWPGISPGKQAPAARYGRVAARATRLPAGGLLPRRWGYCPMPGRDRLKLAA